jgi:hypothetical protein
MTAFLSGARRRWRESAAAVLFGQKNPRFPRQAGLSTLLAFLTL